MALLFAASNVLEASFVLFITLVGLFGGLIGFAALIEWEARKARVKYLKDFGDALPALKDFLSRRFVDIDRDSNGLILLGELRAASQDPAFVEDVELIAEAIEYFPLIGHVIASWEEPVSVPYRSRARLTRRVAEYGLVTGDLDTVVDRNAARIIEEAAPKRA